MDSHLEELAYPIGRFVAPEGYDRVTLNQWISRIEAAPHWYDYCIENLDKEQFDTPYRPGGWTINQVIHHVADSHMNAYIRFKLALTEDEPVIMPYPEKRWALLPDVEAVPANISITLIHALHRRWAALLHALTEEQWERCYVHPEHDRKIPLWEAAAMYAWHGKHHFEHIYRLRDRMGWL
jgi:hypothetical protein